MKDEFPPNSHSKREGSTREKSERPSEKREVVQVTRNKATLRKKPLRRRFVETFTGDGSKGVFEYVLLDVMVPGFKDIVADASTTAIERTLFGEATGGRRRSRGGGSYTSYNRMGAGRPRSRDRDRDDDRRSSRRGRDRGPSDHQEIILDSRVEADEVIDNMFELISKYDVATMRDLLSLVGEPHNYTDEDWGWTDLRGARIHRLGNQGYLLDLPRPESLD